MITTKSQFSRGLLELTLSSCRLFGLPDIPAQRIPAAAQELISCISAGSGRPKDQRAAAPGTGRGALEALLQMINVLQVCSARLRQHLCFDGRLYPRNEIPSFFEARFTPGSWNSGMVTVGRHLILLVTLTKGNLAAGNQYVDRFVDAQTFEWQSQDRTTQASKHGQIINGSLPGHDVHLFVRSTKLRGAKAAPFTYCGVVAFQKWTGEKPITVTWKLSNPVPDHLRRLFDIGA